MSTNEGWTKVTKGFKQQQGDVKEVTCFKTKSHNKYELSKSLEKKLHLNSGISAMFSGSKSQSKAAAGSNLKCYKKNQHRNARRKQKRIQKQRLMNEERKQSSSDKDLNNTEEQQQEEAEVVSNLVTNLTIESLPLEVLAENILPFLAVSDLASFGNCSQRTKSISENKHHWQSRFNLQFPNHNLSFASDREYKLAYKLHTTGAIHKQRCFHSKKTFFEDILGLGIDFTVNPKTKVVDYINTSQDLFSASSFNRRGIKSDAFGNEFKLFLPLYFSRDHFRRALPTIKSTVMSLCLEGSSCEFHPYMILDVLPKIVNTFTVLVSSEGVAASKKSFIGLTRIYRLFLALAEMYPSIEAEALYRIRKFIIDDTCRSKKACPSLGNFLPLLIIVDRNVAKWSLLRSKYISESLTRSVLWVLKKHPELERKDDKTTSCIDQRLQLTREAAQVGMRLNMLQVHFVSFLCQGPNLSCATRLDNFLEEMEEEELESAEIESCQQQLETTDGDELPNPKLLQEQHEAVDSTERQKEADKEETTGQLSFSTFRTIVNDIFTVDSWSGYFHFMQAPRPKSKEKMTEILRNAVKESIRKKYHKPGMDFARIHASGTSKILSKGQQYNAGGLNRVIFTDNWTFDGATKYLDATCLVYKKEKLVSTVDYSQRISLNSAIRHSGDRIEDDTGLHTIELDLCRLDSDVTSCVFVLSAWAEATLLDISSASVSFVDAEDASTALCTYNLDAHDKVAHLKSIVMCKLYRTGDGHWHVIAIGDSHKGSADNYGPIYSAAKKYL